MMDSSAPCARLCHIVKWEHFDGYGFNLHAEKGKNGQFIGKVDEGSPSEAAGLKQGDRIVEVNEINIANESHKQVVERIKAFPTETKLLVVDQPADDYFKAGNLPIKGTMPGVKYLKTPERNYSQDDEDEVLDGPGLLKPNKTTSNGSQGTTSDTHSIASSGDGHSSSHSNSNSMTANNSGSTHNKEHNGNGSSTMMMMMSTSSNDNNEDNISNKSSSSSSKDIQPIAGPNGSLNLKMSAKELRAQLAARKKYDPKKLSMDFKDKFDIVQKL